MSEKYVIGIDLGGTKICGAIGNANGEIYSKYTLPTEVREGENAVLNRIIKVIQTVIKDSQVDVKDIRGIGIGSPGPLDAKNGIIITTPNLPFKNFNLIEPIKNKFNIPVFLDNDANVAAIGEFLLGAGQQTENMVYVTVSTGIGGGAIINGKIYRGNTSNALEIGHMTILPDGPVCNCGNCGCMEALASGTAIANQGKKAVKNNLNTTLRQYEIITSYEVFREAEKGDLIAREIIDTSLTYLGIGIANIITSFDPEIVIIGGGVSKGGRIILDKIQEEVNKRCFKSMAKNCKIVPAALGMEAGVIGAIALALTEAT